MEEEDLEYVFDCRPSPSTLCVLTSDMVTAVGTFCLAQKSSFDLDSFNAVTLSKQSRSMLLSRLTIRRLQSELLEGLTNPFAHSIRKGSVSM